MEEDITYITTNHNGIAGNTAIEFPEKILEKLLSWRKGDILEFSFTGSSLTITNTTLRDRDFG